MLAVLNLGGIYKELRKALMANTVLQGSAEPCFRGVRISFVSRVKEFSFVKL